MTVHVSDILRIPQELGLIVLVWHVMLSSLTSAGMLQSLGCQELGDHATPMFCVPWELHSNFENGWLLKTDVQRVNPKNP